MIKVEFDGFVTEKKEFDWGTVVNVAHNQRGKDEAGEWITTGRDYFKVIVDRSTVVSENDKVQVVGRLKTKSFDKKDGSKGISLEVRADAFVVVSKGKPAPQSAAMIPADWEEIKEDLPF